MMLNYWEKGTRGMQQGHLAEPSEESYGSEGC